MWVYPRGFSPYRLLRDLLLRSYRLPTPALRVLEWTLGVPLWTAFKLYEPLAGPRRRSLREVVFQLHDNLAPQYQHRRAPEELAARFTRLGYADVRALPPATGIVGTKSS